MIQSFLFREEHNTDPVGLAYSHVRLRIITLKRNQIPDEITSITFKNSSHYQNQIFFYSHAVSRLSLPQSFESTIWKPLLSSTLSSSSTNKMINQNLTNFNDFPTNSHCLSNIYFVSGTGTPSIVCKFVNLIVHCQTHGNLKNFTTASSLHMEFFIMHLHQKTNALIF